jgi:hypothetical protein
MKDLRSSRRLLKIWHRREKATIDHLVGSLAGPNAASGKVHSPMTSSGRLLQSEKV